jgi:hypothetical protein
VRGALRSPISDVDEAKPELRPSSGRGADRIDGADDLQRIKAWFLWRTADENDTLEGIEGIDSCPDGQRVQGCELP